MTVAGFGFRDSASATSLHDALLLAYGSGDVDVVATLADKAVSPAFQRLAAELNLPVAAIDQRALQSVETETESAASRSERHVGSVAEAAALAAAGPGARLIKTRVISGDRMATCAIARSAPVAAQKGEVG